MVKDHVLLNTSFYPSEVNDITIQCITLSALVLLPDVGVESVFVHNIDSFGILIDDLATIFEYHTLHALNIISLLWWAIFKE